MISIRLVVESLIEVENDWNVHLSKGSHDSWENWKRNLVCTEATTNFIQFHCLWFFVPEFEGVHWILASVGGKLRRMLLLFVCVRNSCFRVFFSLFIFEVVGTQRENFTIEKNEPTITFACLMSTKFIVETVDLLHNVNVSVVERHQIINIFAV